MSESVPDPEQPGGCEGLDSLDVAGVLAAAGQATADRHAAEVLALQVDLQFAVLHSTEPVRPTGPARTLAEQDAGRNRLVQLGGQGTPQVQDLPICELAIARGLHVTAARHHLADALDLAHRLPRTWARLQSRQGQVWVARRVAARSRKLTQRAVAAVDAAVAEAIDQSPGRLLAIAEAAIIRADPDSAAAEEQARRRQRCLAINQSDEEGLRTVFARIAAGDAAWLDAMIDRVADALATRPDLADPDLTHDDLRVEAFAWLAHPDAVIDLLRGTYPVENEPTEPTEAPKSSSTRQRAVVHVHLAADAVTGILHARGVARVEELGPMLVAELERLLGHARIDVKPVIDLNHGRSVNGYEHPADVKERGHLRTTGDVFPHAQTQSRRADADHPDPYDPNGPPGQTGDHNHAPLGRHHHRAKTHLGYRLWQLAPGRYLWRTPHALWRLVDGTGTHVIDEDTARGLIPEPT